MSGPLVRLLNVLDLVVHSLVLGSHDGGRECSFLDATHIVPGPVVNRGFS